MNEKLKKTELRRQIAEMLKNAEKDIIDNYIDKAFNSGALTEELKLPGNYVLAKLILTAYFNRKPFAPLSASHKRQLKNLEYFL